MQLVEKQRDRISGILSDVGKIVFAALVIGQFLPSFQGTLSSDKLAMGLVVAGICWLGAIMIIRGKE